MKFDLAGFVAEFLKSNAEERFTAREIAEWILSAHPDAVEAKRKASRAKKVPLDSDRAMIQQIVAEIGSRRPALEERSNIRTTEGRPRRYFFSNLSAEEEAEEVIVPTTVSHDQEPSRGFKATITEHDLYPIFIRYAADELKLLSKRIDERKSSNNRGQNGNRWLFPDIVAMEDLSASWDRDVVDCAREYSDKKSKLWSFEIKLRLNSTNVRESFFQAVSNSSWANNSYLVAAEIIGEQTEGELRILSALHGVGVIRIDQYDPSDSQILIPSREKPDVDWNSINRLVEQNSDFREYVRLIRHFYQTGEPIHSMWD